MYERRNGTFLGMRRPNFKPLGWELYLYKLENNKTYKPDYQSIKWVETREYETQYDCLYVNDIDHIEPFQNEARHEGEIKVLKDEVTFLRTELAKALERAMK